MENKIDQIATYYDQASELLWDIRTGEKENDKIFFDIFKMTVKIQEDLKRLKEGDCGN